MKTNNRTILQKGQNLSYNRVNRFPVVFLSTDYNANNNRETKSEYARTVPLRLKQQQTARHPKNAPSPIHKAHARALFCCLQSNNQWNNSLHSLPTGERYTIVYTFETFEHTLWWSPQYRGTSPSCKIPIHTNTSKQPPSCDPAHSIYPQRPALGFAKKKCVTTRDSRWRFAWLYTIRYDAICDGMELYGASLRLNLGG